jgi:hypothetical protein
MGWLVWNEGKGRVGEGERRCGTAHFACLENGSVVICEGTTMCDDVVVSCGWHSSVSVAVVLCITEASIVGSFWMKFM